ncbi:MAG: class I tRNA ligase family protein, partial [Rhodospirillales bacterium]|nr:class I tRNA ligase family protein [Rhodospirillales bacterium]
PEILKQQAELYRRLRNSLRWILGSLDGFSEAERVATEDFPDLEKFLLHRLWELNGKLQAAVDGHDWTGVYPAIHHFCTTDLSAFYFDIRKDSLYCDAPSSHTRKACRSFLDILFRCLGTWLAPALPFTAEEAWMARYGAEASVHLEPFGAVSDAWRNDELAERFVKVRALRGDVTGQLEQMRAAKHIGSSLQAVATLGPEAKALNDSAAFWADICITSDAWFGNSNGAAKAPDRYKKCERCWRVLPEVGENAKHPTLCRRCCEAVEEIG